jgi:prevent-host-death family protein
MSEKKAGIREFKAGLSGYLKEVKKGNTVVITERGHPVGRIIPAEDVLEDRVKNLVRSGIASWSGKRLSPGRTRAKLKAGKKTLGDIVVDNRD